MIPTPEGGAMLEAEADVAAVERSRGKSQMRFAAQ